jgi:uncharacterized protein YceH (UPF0502 family)
MALQIDPTEVRVLACLVEKEIATPEYYPLTLNALVLACNQKSNRDPVVSFAEETVAQALDSLRSSGLAAERTGGGSRVPKYLHRFTEVLNLGRREIALMCELMLRGPQTPGELRSRTERLHAFTDVQEVETCLEGLMQFDAQPLVARLPRQPGTKEFRYAHLLSGEPAAPETKPPAERAVQAGSTTRVEELEGEIAELRQRLEHLEQQFSDFRRSFE